MTDMPDDLRTRIAAALKAEDERPHICPFDGEPTMASYDVLADAVIRELKLQPETLFNPGGAILNRLDGKVLADNRYMTRWATPWEADESPVK